MKPEAEYYTLLRITQERAFRLARIQYPIPNKYSYIGMDLNKKTHMITGYLYLDILFANDFAHGSTHILLELLPLLRNESEVIPLGLVGGTGVRSNKITRMQITTNDGLKCMEQKLTRE